MFDDLTMEERIAIAPVLRKIKSMTKPLARAYLKREWSHYAQVHDDLLTFVPDAPEKEKNYTHNQGYDPHRKHFVPVAWASGASMPQIGAMFGVRSQTIQRQVDNAIPKGPIRHQMRISTGMAADRLKELKELYYGMIEEDSHVFDKMDPFEVAWHLHDLPTHKPDDEDDQGFDELSAPDRRIS